MSEEEWRPAPVEGQGDRYQVSNLGRVRSQRKGGWHVLSAMEPSPNDTATYLRVTIGRKKHFIHRLVAMAFLPPPQPGQTRVLHRDGDYRNCRWDNLRWGTARENAIEAMRHRTLKGSVLTEDLVRSIRGLRRRHNMSLEELERLFPVSRRGLLAVINRQTWDHIP